MDKVKYVKPTVMIEHYAMTQAISACSIRVGSTDIGCIIKDPDPSMKVKDLVLTEGYFLMETDFQGCATQPLDSDENGLCYHTASNSLFVS